MGEDRPLGKCRDARRCGLPGAARRLLGFSLTSQRQLWFDGKYGAAVMWSPSYYPIWKERRSIPVDRAMIDRKPAGIDFVAIPCDDTITQPPMHSQDGICVYKLT